MLMPIDDSIYKYKAYIKNNMEVVLSVPNSVENGKELFINFSLKKGSIKNIKSNVTFHIIVFFLYIYRILNFNAAVNDLDR